ncbi:tRNA lysidine(34) synthetase TilS [Patescibacteria group bacterium]|nr:tRNA lysidine(34) synthetase TilS [Patescibacteria group bacterium]MBU1682353.1 tRNA lysidine(34) synthetase TilS [Patescibacteria group bacterium]MBU1935410.1 tRNA lysidine(34) synthetase TilS [Patescibacteria group bacterium]
MNFTKSVQSGLKKIPPFKKVVIAVSGGVDSVVLAHVLLQLDYDVVIAHLNHKLREEESDADEQLVRNLAKEWGVECVTKKATIPKTGNLENNARQIRYQFLEEVRNKHNADFIAVAHHLNDQIETILMHMARGAGLRGQIGMEFQSGNIIRPLLDVKRLDVVNYAKENNLPYRTDRSNYDLSNDRNYWRHLVIPYFRGANLAKKIQSISKKAKEKLETISKKSDGWVRENMENSRTNPRLAGLRRNSVRGNQFNRSEFNKLSDDLKSEILIQILGAKDLYQKSINRLLDFIENGKSGRQLTVKNKDFFIEYDNILLGVRTPSLPTAKITAKGIKWGVWKLKSDKSGLYVRAWKKGDRFQPSGMKGSKKLQDFFVDSKVPRHLRHQIPIIVDKNDIIVSVGDLRLAEGVKNSEFSLILNA